MNFIDLSKKVELVCVDGRSDIEKIQLSAKALNFSSKNIKFSKIKLFSTYCPTFFDETYIYIKNLSMIEYNDFLINSLVNYIESDYVLLVQWDGFVLRPELWNDIFLNYDYVGAPWPSEWPNRAGRVGNGGFSLRSKKLMDFVSKMGFVSKEDSLEDNYICLENRKLIEENGFKFATVDVAAKFSWENPIKEGSPMATFGFHGRHLPIHKEFIKLLN
jgi:hypothetical protein